MERLKEEIVAGPTLGRLDISGTFYIKIYWYKDGIGVMFMQAYDSVEVRNPEAQEKAGVKCEFDKYLK